MFSFAFDRLNEKNKEYSDLEDEFRMALQIEANRYNEVCSFIKLQGNRFKLKLELCVETKKSLC